MRISKFITDMIISDNIFCLELALHLNRNNVFIKQLSLEKQAERLSVRLLHPLCIEFYKKKDLMMIKFLINKLYSYSIFLKTRRINSA